MKSIFAANNRGQIDYVYPEYIKEYLKENVGLEPSVTLNSDNLEKLRAELCETEYIFSTWSMPSFSEEQIEEYMPKLKAVFYAAGTVQSFARPFLKKGIQVFSAWAANAVPVAEYTVAQIILANKGFFLSSAANKRQDRATASRLSRSCPGNFGAKVGLIGVGMIGALVANMLKSYKLKVLAFDPFCSPEKAEALGVELCSLETLFSECQVISNHLANNPQTVGMLNYGLFSLMKDNATFINTGRGAQVVEEDLFRAMREKPECCAVVDVTWPEPPVKDSPFFTLDNVVITPHIAGSQSDEVHRMAEYVVEEYKAFSVGAPTRYSVSEKMLETMA